MPPVFDRSKLSASHAESNKSGPDGGDEPLTGPALERIARELLRMERDMTLPGSGCSDATRPERLASFIEGKKEN